ncbi:restriction endonuclease subunit S [Streptococcus pseudopneumoniae]|uniref:Restriction endonuclease subunit S n=2 Tax=Streptococcus TaxID=1301 RepID=A0AAW4C7D9_9STRE|nr:restriction endonuclease subunit S [Streptococcus pseudopneumoniae]
MGFEAYYPKYSEQQKIGAYFRNLDHLITLQQRKLEVLKEQKKTYLKLLFPAKGQTKPALRFAGFEDEWKEVKLGEVFDIVTDYVANGSFESLRNNVRTYEKDNFAYMIRLQDASNSWKGPWLYTDEKGYNFLSKSRLFKDDILMSNVGTVGRFFQVPELDRPMTLAPNSVLIRSTSSNNQFLYFMMLTANIQDQITMRKTPGVQDKINKTDFKKVIATLPALSEQEAIGSFFQDLDKAIAKQEEKVNQLKESKQTLLRKMFI